MGDRLRKTAPETAFIWTTARTQAALLLAEDRCTDEDIAQQVGVSRRTLANWKCAEPFAERIRQHVADYERSVSRLSIASRRRRVGNLDRILADLQRVREARAIEYDGKCPGGETGLLVHQVKIGGGGENVVVIDEYVIDGGLISQTMALQKMAAQELGQWSEKATVTHDGGIRREIVVVLEGDTGTVDVTDDAMFADIGAEVEALFAAEPHPEDEL